MNFLIGVLNHERCIIGNNDFSKFWNAHRSDEINMLEDFLFELLMSKREYEKIYNPIFSIRSINKFLENFNKNVTSNPLSEPFYSNINREKIKHLTLFDQIILCNNPNIDRDIILSLPIIQTMRENKMEMNNIISIILDFIINTLNLSGDNIFIVLGKFYTQLSHFINESVIERLFIRFPNYSLDSIIELFSIPNVPPRIYDKYIIPKYENDMDFWRQFSRNIDNDSEWIESKMDRLTDNVFYNRSISSDLITRYMKNRNLEFIPIEIPIFFKMDEKFIMDYLPKIIDKQEFSKFCIALSDQTQNIQISDKLNIFLDERADYCLNNGYNEHAIFIGNIACKLFQNVFLDYFISHTIINNGIPFHPSFSPIIYETIILKNHLNRELIYKYGNYSRFLKDDNFDSLKLAKQLKVLIDDKCKYKRTKIQYKIDLIWSFPTIRFSFIRKFPREYIPNNILSNFFLFDTSIAKREFDKLFKIDESDLKREILLRENRVKFAPNGSGYLNAKRNFQELLKESKPFTEN